MKTSFYFVLWLGVYLLIELLGSNWMIENSFFVALAAVFVISGVLTTATKNQRLYTENRENAALLEIIYRNELKRYIAIFRRKLIFDILTVIYFTITIIFLIMVHESFFIILIFGYFAIGNFLGLIKSYESYSQVKNSDVFVLDEEYLDSFNRYKEYRDAGYGANQMYPAATWKDKLFKGCNISCSIIAILIGILFICFSLPGLLEQGALFMGSAMFVAYGALAFIYGISDLYSSINGFSSIAK